MFKDAFEHIAITCADPESFVRGGPTLMGLGLCCFSLLRGGRIQIPLLAGHQLSPSKMPKWRFAGGQMMAQHGMLAW